MDVKEVGADTEAQWSAQRVEDGEEINALFETGRLGAIALGLERQLEAGHGDSIWTLVCQAAAQYSMGFCFAYVKDDGAWRRVACRHGLEVFQDLAKELEREEECRGVVAEQELARILLPWSATIPMRVGPRLLGCLVIARRTAMGTADVDGMAMLVKLAIETVREREEEDSAGMSTTMGAWAHEIKTPLSACMAYTELLVDGIYGMVPPEQMQVLHRMMVAERHMAGLVSGVMDWAKAGSGTMMYDMHFCSIGDLVRDLEALIMVEDRIVQIACSQEGQCVLCDVFRTRQILVNLVGNAIKFTGSGGHIKVTCRDLGGRVGIVVEDDGPGVDQKDWEAIFEPFIQKGRRGGAGVGLGLAISRRLARAMDGDVRVEAHEGPGASFVLELPKAAPDVRGPRALAA